MVEFAGCERAGCARADRETLLVELLEQLRRENKPAYDAMILFLIRVVHKK